MKTILVVDDEKLIRWSLCEALLKDYVVYTADSAEEALNLLGRVPVDAVITDLRMPGMNGVEFAQILRKRYPNVPVFALTAYATEQVVKDLQAQGVLECLAKPFHMGEVRAMLERHLMAAGA